VESRSFAEVIELAVRNALEHVHTSLPARVLSFDAAKNTVDVELGTKAATYDRDTGEREYEERPQLASVPVVWPRGGGYVMTLPLAAGDFVWLMFAEQGLGEWRASGEVSEPVDARRHSIGHPVALPGAFPDVSPLSPLDVANRSTKLVLGADGTNTQIVIDKATPSPTILLGKDATDFVALANLVQAALDTIRTHTHPVSGVTAGASTELAPGLGPVAATVVKAE
jgi:hypothetical protein